MALYAGTVTSYDLTIMTPTAPTDYKSVIILKGTFGRAAFFFVPDGGQLGINGKRPGENVFDAYYWMSSWMHFVDLLRNEKPINFYYDEYENKASLQTETGEPVGEQEGV